MRGRFAVNETIRRIAEQLPHRTDNHEMEDSTNGDTMHDTHTQLGTDRRD